MTEPTQNKYCVHLIGAGPGDPGLITLKGVQLLKTADCIVYDALANPALLEHAGPNAERICVGKRANRHLVKQDQINEILADRALAGNKVIRLKGGDPFVFGRGAEEAAYLKSRGVNIQIVPGVPAAIAAAAYAGIPVTRRQISTAVVFLTGHEDPDKGPPQIDYNALAELTSTGATLCIYMGMTRLDQIVKELIDADLSPDTPSAVVRWGTLPRQQSIQCPLDQLSDTVAQHNLKAPAMIYIGKVIPFDQPDALNWYETLPLFGKTVLITRTRTQASQTRQRLEDLGANVLEAPTIDIQPITDWSQVDDAVDRIASFNWLVLTSAQAVHALFDRLRARQLDTRALTGPGIAVVGDQTAQALQQFGITPDLIPQQFNSDALANELLASENLADQNILMFRADIAPITLPEKLKKHGANISDVTIYRNIKILTLPKHIIEHLKTDRIDWLTFTSSSTFCNFVELTTNSGVNADTLDAIKIASIGPKTSASIQKQGLSVTIEASPHDIEGMINGIVNHETSAEDE